MQAEYCDTSNTNYGSFYEWLKAMVLLLEDMNESEEAYWRNVSCLQQLVCGTQVRKQWHVYWPKLKFQKKSSQKFEKCNFELELNFCDSREEHIGCWQFYPRQFVGSKVRAILLLKKYIRSGWLWFFSGRLKYCGLQGGCTSSAQHPPTSQDSTVSIHGNGITIHHHDGLCKPWSGRSDLPNNLWHGQVQSSNLQRK